MSVFLASDCPKMLLQIRYVLCSLFPASWLISTPRRPRFCCLSAQICRKTWSGPTHVCLSGLFKKSPCRCMFSVGWSQIKCQNPKCSRALFSILIYISNISGFSTFRNAKYQTACFSLFWPLQKFTHFFHMFSVLGSRSCPRYITRASCHVLSFLVLTHVSNISGFPNLKIEVKTSMFLSFLRFLKTLCRKYHVLCRCRS